MKWDWQVFYPTAVHSIIYQSTVSQLLVHLTPVNFVSGKQNKENKISVQTKLQIKSTVFSVNLDQASVLK